MVLVSTKIRKWALPSLDCPVWTLNIPVNIQVQFVYITIYLNSLLSWALNGPLITIVIGYPGFRWAIKTIWANLSAFRLSGPAVVFHSESSWGVLLPYHMPEDPAMEASASVFFSILVDDLMSFCWMNRGGTKSPTTPEGAMAWFFIWQLSFPDTGFRGGPCVFDQYFRLFLNHTEKNTRSNDNFPRPQWLLKWGSTPPRSQEWRYESRLLDVLISAGSIVFRGVFLVEFHLKT